MKKIYLLTIFAAMMLWGVSCADDSNDSPTPEPEEEMDNEDPNDDGGDNGGNDGGNDGGNTITYSEDVSDILVRNCTSCHGNNGGVNLETYEEVKKSVDNGLLLCTIKHEEGCSPMPKNRNKLSDNDIAKIESWVEAGAPNN